MSNAAAELERINGLITQAVRRLNATTQQADEAERQYRLRMPELRNILESLEQSIRDARTELQEYDRSMKAIRAADEARLVELSALETSLRGREHLLSQERQDFEQEKKRWKQTKDLY